MGVLPKTGKTAPGTAATIGTYHNDDRYRIIGGTAGLGTAGPAFRGPAFVPISVDDIGGFNTVFGRVSAESFATVAVNAWLGETAGCTFIRLLGIGDGKKRIAFAGTNAAGENLPVGAVKNSGFIVGGKMTGSNGYLSRNKYATDLGMPGRTFFLGAFMSESNGSQYLSDAGLQKEELTAATAKITPVSTTPGDYAGGKLLITDSKTDTTKTYLLCSGDNGGALTGTPATGDDAGTVGGTAGEVCVQLGTAPISIAAIVTRTQNAINSALGNNAGVPLSNLVVDGTTSVDIAQVAKGPVGNYTITREIVTSDSTYTISGFSGGTGGAIPIIRGVLFAASGVLPALSGNYTGNASTASLGPTAGSFADKQDGGSTIGSVNLNAAEESFTLLLNGHINTSEYPNEILASFSPNATSGIGDDATSIYFPNVLNTDPTKINQAGYYLYSYYDIQGSQAQCSGEGIVRPSTNKIALTLEDYTDCGFLVSSSIDRNATDSAGSLAVPNFENFSDRFQTAKSPTVFSQTIQNKQFDLFKFHALDDGAIGNEQIKISISNLSPPESEDEYGTFDVTIREIRNLDSSFDSLSGSFGDAESFLECSLDPTADNYISKMIGDQHYYYNFDAKRNDGQRFVLAGEHTNKSRLVRVEVTDQVKNQILPTKILPAGFHGFGHLVTSGSSILSNPKHPLSDGSVIPSHVGWANHVVEPPVPYVTRISDDITKLIDIDPGADTVVGTDDDIITITPLIEPFDRQSKFYTCWGVQTTKFGTNNEPNKDDNFNKSILSYSKYYPSFTTARQAAYVSDNVGVADSNGTVYDVDRFNNAKFSLENILVHVDTDDEIRNTEWAWAKYSKRRKKEDLLDSTLTKKSAVRFLDFNKDVTADNISTIKEYLKFTFIMQGGFDGANIFSRESSNFENLAAYFEMLDPAQGNKQGPVVSAYLKALQMLEDKSEVEMKVLALPGVRVEPITNRALEVAETRFDTFYVMDIEEVDSLGAVVTSSFGNGDNSNPDTALTASRFRSRALNSTFGGVYFPDIKMINPDPADPVYVFAPPSISALRVLGRMDSESNVQAPAGFLRGLISDDSEHAVDTKVVMGDISSSETIETLYSVGINPIIPGDEGLCLFGQRTLQTSAETMLQRISVRRMIIDIRRFAKTAAHGILFDQNREDILSTFKEMIEPMLGELVSNGGLSRFKVVVDETTTTQADIENNTVRGKVFIQPNKSDEILQVDFLT